MDKDIVNDRINITDDNKTLEPVEGNSYETADGGVTTGNDDTDNDTRQTDCSGTDGRLAAGMKHGVTLADLITVCRDRGLQVYNDVAHVPAVDRIHERDVKNKASWKMATGKAVGTSKRDRSKENTAHAIGALTPDNGFTRSPDDGSTVQASRRPRQNTASTSRERARYPDWSRAMSSAARSDSTATRRRTDTIHSRTSAAIRNILDEDVDAEESLQQRMRRRSRRHRPDNKHSLEELIYIKQHESAVIPRGNVSTLVPTETDATTPKSEHVTNNHSEAGTIYDVCNDTNHHGNASVMLDSTEANNVSSTSIVTKEDTDKTTGSEYTIKELELNGHETSEITSNDGRASERISDSPPTATDATGVQDIVTKDGSTTLVLIGYKAAAVGEHADLERTADRDTNRALPDVSNQLESHIHAHGLLPNENKQASKTDLITNTKNFKTDVNDYTCSPAVSGNIDIKNTTSNNECRKCDAKASGACNYKPINTEPGEFIKPNHCIHINEPHGNIELPVAVIKDACTRNPCRDNSIVTDTSKTTHVNRDERNIYGNTSFAVIKQIGKQCETSVTQCNDSGIGSDSEKEIGYIQADTDTSPINNDKHIPAVLAGIRKPVTCMGNKGSSPRADTDGCGNKGETINNKTTSSKQNENNMPYHITVYDSESGSAPSADRRTVRIDRRHKPVLEEYRRHIRMLKKEKKSAKSDNTSDLDTLVKNGDAVIDTPAMSGGQSRTNTHSTCTSVPGVTEHRHENNGDTKTPATENKDSVKRHRSRRKDRIVGNRSPVASTSVDDTASYKTMTTTRSTSSSNRNVSAARLFLLMTKLHETYEEEKISQDEYLQLLGRTRKTLNNDWDPPLSEHIRKRQKEQENINEKHVEVDNKKDLERIDNAHDERKTEDVSANTDAQYTRNSIRKRQKGQENINVKHVEVDNTKELERIDNAHDERKTEDVSANTDAQYTRNSIGTTDTIETETGNLLKTLKKATKKIDNSWSTDHPAYNLIKAGFKSNLVIPNSKRMEKELRDLSYNKFESGDLSAENVYLQEAKRIYPKGFKSNDTQTNANDSKRTTVRFTKSDTESDKARTHDGINRQSTPFTKYRNRSTDNLHIDRKDTIDTRRPRSRSYSPELDKERQANTDKHGSYVPNGSVKSNGNRIPRPIKHETDILTKNKHSVNECQTYMKNRTELPLIDSNRTRKPTHIPVMQHGRSASNKTLPVPNFVSDNGNRNVNTRSDKNNNNNSIREGYSDRENQRKDDDQQNMFPGNKGTAAVRKPARSTPASRTADNIAMNKAVDIVKSRKQFYHECVNDTELCRQVRVLRLYRELHQVAASGSRDLDIHTHSSNGHPHNELADNGAGSIEKVSKFLLMDYKFPNDDHSLRKSDSDLNNFIHNTATYELCANGRSLYKTTNRREKALEVLRKLYDRNLASNAGEISGDI